jgi:LCP family protein required for cell wall assembly
MRNGSSWIVLSWLALVMPIFSRKLLNLDFDGVEVNVNNSAKSLPIASDTETRSPNPANNSVPQNGDRTEKTESSQIEPTQTEAAETALGWGRRMLWSASFMAAASLSATAGAMVAMVGPLPSIPNVLTATEKVATAGTPIPTGTGSPTETQEIPPLFQYKIDRPVNILVLGIDRVPDADKESEEIFDGNSDTMLLLRFDPTDNTVRMLSIPRDTQVFIGGVGEAKINSANARGGAELATHVVSRTLNNVPIDRYVRVTNDAFRDLVDLVGGVEVFVPYPMSYTDVTQGLKIDLKPGWQTLDGDRAEQFSRFRMDEYGDIGRVQRQQVLLKALRERLKSPAVVPRLPQAVQMALQYVDTNLSLEEMMALVNFGMSLEKEKVKMVLLPGRFSNKDEFEGVSYWIMSRRGRDRLVSEYFEHDGDYVVTNNRSPNRVRIALQNATNDSKLPELAAQHITEAGFGNIYYSQTKSARLLRKTQIVVQQGDIEAATALKDALGFGEIQSDSTGDLGSEITIRIGSDWFDAIAEEEDTEDTN